MTTNRPRPSLINLFDPLVNSTTSCDTPSTPLRRDAIDADKENVNSSSPFNNSNMSMFVNKISKPSPHPQPKPFQRRLVDIGDMTLEDASCPEALLDESIEDELSACFAQAPEDDENATLTFRDMVKAATPLSKLRTIQESEVHFPSRTTRIPLADLVLAQTPSPPLPELNNEFLSQEEPSVKSITEGSALERVLPSALEPQEAAKPESAIKSSGAPEDIPLPSSPTVATQEHLPTVDVAPNQAVLVNAQEPLNCVNIDRTTCLVPHGSTSRDDAEADNAGKDGSEIQNTHLFGTEERIRSETDAHLETSCFDTSCNDLSPTANISDSTECSDTSSADTSVPAVLSNSSPPSSPMSPSLEPESKLETADTISPLPLATLRPRPPTMAPDNRISVDLHASFQMHMQSEEMSFDLLSDKVSFLTSQGGMESFSTTTEDDPSFDLVTERINMEKALKRDSGTQEEKLSGTSATHNHILAAKSSAPVSQINVPNFPSTPSHPASNGRQVPGAISKTVQKRLSIPVAISSPRLIDVSPISKTRSASISFSPGPSLTMRTSSQRSPVASSGPVFVPPSTLQGRRKSIHLVTPKSKGSTMPEIPMALKIVKRPRPNGHEMSGPGKTERKSSLDLAAGSKEPGASIIGSFRTRKPIQIPETPERAVADLLPSAPRQTARPRSIALPRPSLTQVQPSGSGPRRVPASEGPQPKSAAAARSTTMPPPAPGGPRRVLVPSGSSLTASQPRSSIGTTSSMKVPISAGTSTSTTAPSPPKPASRPSLTSRLPAPRTLKAGSLLNLRRAT